LNNKIMSDYSVDDIMSAGISSSVPTRFERKAKESKGQYDRFIPNRDGMNSNLNLHAANENVCPENVNVGGDSSSGAFNSCLAQSLFQGDDVNSKVLAFKKKAPKPTEQFHNNLRVLYTQQKGSTQAKKSRHISATPERILDAPELVDDYYLNLLHWSSANVLAVALGPCVYLWDASSGSIDMLFEAPEGEHVTSTKWMPDGTHLAVGMSSGDVQMWDAARSKKVRSMKGHEARVGSLAWNSHILSSGSRDSNIFHHDVRVAKHHVATLATHTQEICGLEWSPDGTQLASGGNDNICCIWDANAATNQPRHQFTESNAAQGPSMVPLGEKLAGDGQWYSRPKHPLLQLAQWQSCQLH